MTQRRPIGMRIPRPYETEDDFIRGDGLAIGRLGMILIGAPKRPPGITIRFEVLLRNDKPVFRGEGRVVAHRIHANGREGLEIRFTRLDSRSKALVEQVLQLRRTGALTPLSATNPPPAPGPDESRTEHKAEPSLEADSPNEVRAPTEPPAEEVLDSSELAPIESDPAGRVVEVQDASAGVESAEAEIIEDEEIEEAEPVEDAEIIEVEPIAEAASLNDAEIQEPEVEAPVEEPADEPLDEDPTPFAPPVMLDREHVDEEARQPSAPPPPLEVSEDVAAALAKLRERAGAFEAPDSAGSLLDKLRARAKAD